MPETHLSLFPQIVSYEVVHRRSISAQPDQIKLQSSRFPAPLRALCVKVVMFLPQIFLPHSLAIGHFAICYLLFVIFSPVKALLPP
jgi:hypothetical protein